MEALKSEYLEIKLEIREYLVFITKAAKDGAVFKHKNGRLFKLPDSTNKVLKAAFFLLLYNLVEATVRKSILEIYDFIEQENLGYQDVSNEIQKIWILSHYNAVRDIANKAKPSKTYADKMHDRIKPLILNSKIDLSSSYVKASISGNLNSDRIKELCFSYGISILKETQELEDIKERRNQLAHGDLSFSEVGRDYTIEELGKIYTATVRHLDLVVNKIENYLSKKQYKNNH